MLVAALPLSGSLLVWPADSWATMEDDVVSAPACGAPPREPATTILETTKPARCFIVLCLPPNAGDPRPRSPAANPHYA